MKKAIQVFSISKTEKQRYFGEVMYGNVGSHNRLDFTVIGPAVNETARMESLCDNLKEVFRPVL